MSMTSFSSSFSSRENCWQSVWIRSFTLCGVCITHQYMDVNSVMSTHGKTNAQINNVDKCSVNSEEH